MRGRPTVLVERHGDPAHLQLTDNQVIELDFVPRATSLAVLGAVPSIANLPNLPVP